MINKAINILIVDDEQNAREILQKLINRHFSLICGHIETASDVETATKALIERDYSILFLDIHLGKESGFDVLQQFANRNFAVVFTTAYQEYALKAIKESAFDYLLKPINYIDLLSVFKKLEQSRLKTSLLDKLNSLNTKLIPFNDNYAKIAFPTKDGMTLVALSDIVYCVASGSYSMAILSNNSKITLSRPLKYLEDVLPQQLFFRCHKSYFVNLNYVESYNDTDKQIILNQGVEIPLSIRRKEAFIHVVTRR